MAIQRLKASCPQAAEFEHLLHSLALALSPEAINKPCQRHLSGRQSGHTSTQSIEPRRFTFNVALTKEHVIEGVAEYNSKPYEKRRKD